MNRKEIQRKIELAETNRREAAARVEATRKRLEDLEEQRAEVLGESELARRALTDFERLSEQSRQELATIDLEAATQERDRIVTEAAAALEAAVTLLGEIGARRSAVVEAHQRLAALNPEARSPVPEEPNILDGPWQRMVSAVKSQLDEKLEADLVDAAARSYTGQAINALPEHLRTLATLRRKELQRRSIRRPG